MNQIIESQFKSEILQKVLLYQTVLLGTAPYDTPGIYALMNHVDFNLGVWYPKGGIYEIIKSLVTISKKHRVKLITNSPVEKIIIVNGQAIGVRLENGKTIDADIVISNADYVHTEENLLDKPNRSYSTSYWEKKTLAPSAFILYLGVKGKIPSLQHHNLLFSKDWHLNFSQIFKHPALPDDPSLYICCPSKSDDTVAPKDTENLFVLVPVSAELNYSKKQIDIYHEKILTLMEVEMEIPDLKNRIIFSRRYDGSDFQKDYNSYKGSALGFAHTLMQTSFFRPNTKSKKINNLYYVGADTNPGIGMPICLISAQLVYKRIEQIDDPSPLRNL